VVAPIELVKTSLPRLKSRRFWRYAGVGGSTFVLDFFLLVTLRELLGVNVFIAATVAYWSAIAYNFTMNRQWTFRVGGRNIHKHAASYTALLIFNYFANLSLIWIMTQFGLHYALAKAIAVGIQIPWTYLAYKKIIFT
jgi:putative flippase GtrA